MQPLRFNAGDHPGMILISKYRLASCCTMVAFLIIFELRPLIIDCDAHFRLFLDDISQNEAA